MTRLEKSAPTKPLFILQGNGSLLNRGCEAIFRSTVDILRATIGPCKIVHAPASTVHPNDYQEHDPDVLHVIPRMVRRWRPRWWFHQFQKRLLGRPPKMPFEKYLPMATAVLGVGGDNYTLDYGRPVEFFRAITVTLDRSRPFILWGATVGPFSRDPDFERVAVEILRRVPLICARESLTVEYLASLGVFENVRLCADPAFLLTPEPVELEGDERLILQEPCIGVNFSALAGRYRGNNSEGDWIRLVRQCISTLVKALKAPIVLVPHVFLPQDNDFQFLASAINGLPTGKEGHIVLLQKPYNARQLKWIISHLLLFIGARMHATIASLSSNVPTLSIAYSQKAWGINQDIFGHTEWVIGVRDLSPSILLAKTQHLLAERARVQQQLSDRIPVFKERARLGGLYLKSIIESWPYE